jgi:hypothetical protein
MFSLFKRDPPIIPTNIDLMSWYEDGLLRLWVIPTSSRLDGSPETQKLLLDKVELYLDFLQSEECKSEFGELTPAQKVIILRCYFPPHRVMRALFPGIADWVRERGATFEVRYAWWGRPALPVQMLLGRRRGALHQ